MIVENKMLIIFCKLKVTRKVICLVIFMYVCRMKKILTKKQLAKEKRNSDINHEYLKQVANGSGSYAVLEHLSTMLGISLNTLYKITKEVRNA